MSVQAGFPPALLNPMNFEMIYRQYQQHAKEKQVEETEADMVVTNHDTVQ